MGVTTTIRTCILLTGEIIAKSDRCPTCKGAKTTKETKVSEVTIDKGMVDGQKIPLRGEADQQVSVYLPLFVICVLCTYYLFYLSLLLFMLLIYLYLFCI